MFRTSQQRAISAVELMAAVFKCGGEYNETLRMGLRLGKELGFSQEDLEAARKELDSRRFVAPEAIKRLEGALNTIAAIKADYRDWQRFYLTYFNLDVDVEGIHLPLGAEGFDRQLFVAEGMTPNRLYEACSKLFPCRRYTENLDAITSGRDPAKGAYSIKIQNRVEADEKLKGKSANHLAISDIKGRMTFPERLLYELKYFDETGEHLDVESATLCTGSRDTRLGEVPYVHWDAKNNRMNVDWHEPYTPINYGFSLRARAVIA